MRHAIATDPLAKTMGLVPRYVRERQAAEARAKARPAAPPPAPIVHPEPVAAPTSDPVTADLRRRIAVAKPQRPRGVKLIMAAPAVAGVLLVLGVLLNN